MSYRTRTYIAGDWTGDADLIQQIRAWNKSNYWGLDFIDAHDFTSASDDDLFCSIKSSLAGRMDTSKTFVLIVGDKTKDLRAGSCTYCRSYNAYLRSCARGHSLSSKSYIEYECDKAIRDKLRIVVIYNSNVVSKHKCPASIQNYGMHLPAYQCIGRSKFWNYEEIRKAIMGA